MKKGDSYRFYGKIECFEEHMIRIRGNFIKSIDGAWHNLRMIKSLYVGGDDEVGYRICMSFEYSDVKTRPISFGYIGKTLKTKEEAQAQLDAIFDLMEYERC